MDRVHEVTKEVFNALTQIRRADPRAQPSPEMLYQRMRSFIDRAQRRAAELGFAPHDAQEIGFALVALTDELVMSQGGQLRDFWLPRSLQLQLFNTNVAGEAFFDKLAALRNDSTRLEVLKVYYLCLLFGFQGKYAVRGGEIELSSLVEEIGGTLTRAGQIGEPPLSPHAARPAESLGGGGTQMPLVWVSLAAVLLAFGVYLALSLSVSSQADDLVDHIQTVTEGAASDGAQ